MAKKYIRFTQTKLRDEADLVQLSCIEFYDAKESKLKVKNVSNPDGCNPDDNVAANAIDNDLSNKWADMKKGPLLFELPKALYIATYKWATANDCSERDPIRWKLEGSSDKKKWVILDDRSKTDYETPEERDAWTKSIVTDWKREQDKKADKKKASKKKPAAKEKKPAAKATKAGKRKSSSSTRSRSASKRKR